MDKKIKWKKFQTEFEVLADEDVPANAPYQVHSQFILCRNINFTA